MKRAARKKPSSRHQRETLPVVVVARDGKTTIRQFEGRRFVRLGEICGKKVALLELFTSGDGHYLTLRFQDRTVLSLELIPMFTLKPELCRLATGDPKTIKRWPEIKSER